MTLHLIQMKRFALIPIFGIVLYVILFFIATFLYTGGHETAHDAKGFSWVHNYWCDLMAVEKFGRYNEAHLIAKAGHIVITASVLVFFLVFPYLFESINRRLRGVQLFGALAMISILFVFTEWHNTSINLMVFFGLIAGILGLVELWQSKKKKTLLGAIICLSANVVGYLMYATNFFIEFLPAFQKVIIVITFIWIIKVCLSIRRKASI